VREVEVKFRVHPNFELPELTGIAGLSGTGPPAHHELVAQYVDTGDLRLARDGITLRRRVGDGQDGWQLKLPVLDAGEGVRDELHDPDPGESPPGALTALVTAWTRFAPLLPVATLVTDRHLLPLLGPAGELVAELVDDRVEVREGDHAVARFREIEVEDKGGGQAVLTLVGGVLSGAGAVGGEFVPKAVRALGPRASAPPDPPVPGPVGPDDPVTDAIAAFLRRHVRALMGADLGIRRGQPDSVHQLRVATRRLRSGLKTFAPVLDPEWVAGLREELGWLAREFSPARDAEVLLARLAAEVERLDPTDVRGPVGKLIEAELGPELARVTPLVDEVLGSERYIALLQRGVDGATFPRMLGTGTCAEIVPGLVAEGWRRLTRRVSALDPAGPAEEYHRARIAAKHARYAVEAAAPVFGKPARRLATAITSIQDILGEHQDAVVAAALLRRLASAPGGRAATFTLGLLCARQLDAAKRARCEFAGKWPKVSQPALRQWLDG